MRFARICGRRLFRAFAVARILVSQKGIGENSFALGGFWRKSVAEPFGNWGRGCGYFHFYPLFLRLRARKFLRRLICYARLSGEFFSPLKKTKKFSFCGAVKNVSKYESEIPICANPFEYEYPRFFLCGHSFDVRISNPPSPALRGVAIRAFYGRKKNGHPQLGVRNFARLWAVCDQSSIIEISPSMFTSTEILLAIALASASLYPRLRSSVKR